MIAVCSCGHEHPKIVDGETEGFVTGFAEDSGGADETAGPQPEGCVFGQGLSGFSGVKYQCSMEFTLNVHAVVDPALAPSFAINLPEADVAQPIVTANDSTYEHPLVMACCTETVVPDNVATCTFGFDKACWNDLIKTVCYSAGDLLEAKADALLPGDGSLALDKFSDDYKDNHRQQCFDFFWSGGDSICDPGEFCDQDFCEIGHITNFEFPTFAPGNSLQYLSSTVDSLEVDLKAIMHEPGVRPLPADPDTCENAEGNNGDTVHSVAPGPPGGFLSPTANVPIHVIGPAWQGEIISGSGEFSTTSRIHRHVDGLGGLKIDDWTMTEAAPTTVGTRSLTWSVDTFELRLATKELLPVTQSTWSAPAGTMAFHLSSSVDGDGDGVTAVNADKVSFFVQSPGVGRCPTSAAMKCLVSRAFQISYVDAFGDTWQMEIPQITWKP